MSKEMTYANAGVNLEVAAHFKKEILSHLRRTYGPRVIDNPGGFGGLFSLDSNTRLFTRNYRRPVLVASTDGVGTKLKIAFMMDKHDTVGSDLVAMSVNDILVQGAEPIFFLDYIACDKIVPERHLQIVKGVADGCVEAGCALLGGETAQMPGLYAEGEYDLAGFAVGVCERSRIITGDDVAPGDVIIGLHSTGLHSNGFSLVRKIFFEQAGMKVTDVVPELDTTLGEELLKPTRIYATPIRKLLAYYRKKKVIQAIANITGGSFAKNIPRVLPKNCAAHIQLGSWKVPPIFKLVQKVGDVADDEMYRVFNMGIGMVVIVHKYYADSALHILKRAKQPASAIGQIKTGAKKVIFE
jgi:phosphoribosylformylglycinamidine cyclo-ligase